MNGRVKTINPMIEGGILGLRDKHSSDAEKNNIKKKARESAREQLDYQRDRVLKAKKSLQDNNITQFGKFMNESHWSYSKDFEASTEDVDNIINKSIECGALGARLTGGGFGGFTVSLLEKNNFLVSKSYKNFNNKLGLQFSIMNMKLNSNFSIFELGINAPREMKSLINILHPHYCLITGIENSHIGNFKNFNTLVNNKLQIFQSKNLIKGFVNFSHSKPDLTKKIKSNIQLVNFDNIKVSVTKKNKYSLSFKDNFKKHNIESDLNGIYIETAIISYLFLKKFIDERIGGNETSRSHKSCSMN